MSSVSSCNYNCGLGFAMMLLSASGQMLSPSEKAPSFEYGAQIRRAN